MNKRLYELRKTLNLSQEDLGEKVYMTRGAISNIENGARELTDKNINIICRTYNVNENWLRTGTGEMFVNFNENLLELIASKLKDLTDIEKTALSEFIKLPDEQRRLFLKILKTLVF